LRYLIAARQLRRLVKRLRPDVVNAHYLSSYGVLAALASSRPLVQTTWGTDIHVTAKRPIRRTIAKLALRRAILATGDSRSLLEGIAELAPGLDTHRFVFGPSGLPTSGLTSGDRRVVLSPRAHEPLYNIDVVLGAWDALAPHLPHHELVVAGTGSLTAELRALAGRRVRFVGQVDHDEITQLLGSSEVVLSIPDEDATSASVLEALAAGCAVVATDVDAAREWLDEQCLVPRPPTPRDVAAVALRVRGRSGSLDERWSLENQVRELLARTTAARTVKDEPPRAGRQLPSARRSRSVRSREG
jgi:glycosyltransferase involved in cell wall biosynthesis